MARCVDGVRIRRDGPPVVLPVLLGDARVAGFVRFHRQALGLRQGDLAGLVGCSKELIKHLEGGKTVGRSSVLAVLFALAMERQGAWPVELGL